MLIFIFVSVAAAACGEETAPPPPTYYTITKADTVHGSFTVSHKTATKGTVISVNPFPDDGYHVSAMYVIRTDSPTQSVPDNVHNSEFIMPDYDATVTVAFAENAREYLIHKAADNENGTFSADKTTAPAGDTVIVTAIPNEGFAVGAIYVKNFAVPSAAGITVSNGRFLMPEFDVLVSVAFIELVEHNITRQQPDNGMITPNKTAAVYEETVAITVTPAEGYVFGSLTVAYGVTYVSVTKLSETLYTFIMPNASVTIAGVFKKLYNVGIGQVSNGAIICYTESDIAGVNIEFRVLPNNGWIIDTVTVTGADNSPVGVIKQSTNIYTFTLPATDVTISAAFKKVDYFVRLYFESPTAAGQYSETYTDYFGAGTGYIVGKGLKYSALKDVYVNTFTPEIHALLESINDNVDVKSGGYVLYYMHPQTVSFGIVQESSVLSLSFYWTRTVQHPKRTISIKPFNGGTVDIKDYAIFGDSVIFTIDTNEGYFVDDNYIAIWETGCVGVTGHGVMVSKYQFGNTVYYGFIMPDFAVTVEIYLVELS
jgi:hypothetical protein